jgi:hypothetical protein
VSGKVFTVSLVFAAIAISAWADDTPQGPKLLLNAQRLRRLKRDRERKTVRWVNFENRVNNAPDSPERGFELALYYAVTGDEAKGREAVQWALSHNSVRQKALILDWCAPLISPDQKRKLEAFGVVVAGTVPGIQSVRDRWFVDIASGAEVKSPPEGFLSPRLDWLVEGRLHDPNEVYALCELIYAIRAATHTDLRETDPHFFSTLPSLLLLSAKPSQLNSPAWMLHAAALALVALDPNLPASQFLQSWALEDSQTLREGPGVAYELLWADPYLPGVGYQNMETWVDDDHAHLFARASWEPNSCWIAVSPQRVEQENCPPDWQSEPVTFGRLTLIPMTDRCVEIPHLTNHNESVLVWKVKPGEKLTHGKGKDQHTSEADAAGIWRPGANVEGKVCVVTH